LSQSSSEIKIVSLELLKILDSLIQPELKNVILKQAWNMFALSKGQAIIMKKPDSELQFKMKQAFDLMLPIFQKVELANEIKETKSLNSGKMQNFVESRLGKDVLELIP
jgi:hypothetical protein